MAGGRPEGTGHRTRKGTTSLPRTGREGKDGLYTKRVGNRKVGSEHKRENEKKYMTDHEKERL